MDLPTFIRSIGVAEAAALFKESPRQIKAWMHRERTPRPKVALKIERLTKGKVRFVDIYAAPDARQ